MTADEWVMSLDNPTRAKYVVHRLWKNGIRYVDDAKLVALGYDSHEISILSEWFKAIGDMDFFEWYNDYYLRFRG